MRSRSSANFTADDMAEIAAFCTERGVKDISYRKHRDIRRRYGTYAHHYPPRSGERHQRDNRLRYGGDPLRPEIGQEVHISTQVNVSNIEAVKFYAQFADVMVLARELNMEQVTEISRAIEAGDIRGPHGDRIRLEIISATVPLCMAVSGKCYMSLHEMNSSANRGHAIRYAAAPTR